MSLSNPLPRHLLRLPSTAALGVCSVLAPTLTACSSPKDASKKNFAKAIQKKLDSLGCDSIHLRAKNGLFTRLPSPLAIEQFVPGASRSADDVRQTNATRNAPFEALREAGLLAVKETVEKAGHRGQEIQVRTYEPTEKGRANQSADHAASFCVGRTKVDEIVRYSEPGSFAGVTISQVVYKSSVRGVPEWANREDVRKAFPALAKTLSQSPDSKAVLKLNNDGWEVELLGGF